MPTPVTVDLDNLTPAARRILDVASDLFYRHGIRAIGVDTIAEQAQVTKKTIYDRFGSKDALIAAYLERRNRRWHALIERRVMDRNFAPRERILAMFEIMDEELRERGCSFINAHGELGEDDHPAVSLSREQKVWTRDLFVQFAREAGATDPDTLGSQLLMLHEGAYIAYAMANEVEAALHGRDAAAVLVDAAIAGQR